MQGSAYPRGVRYTVAVVLCCAVAVAERHIYKRLTVTVAIVAIPVEFGISST